MLTLDFYRNLSDGHFVGATVAFVVLPSQGHLIAGSATLEAEGQERILRDS